MEQGADVDAPGIVVDDLKHQLGHCCVQGLGRWRAQEMPGAPRSTTPRPCPRARSLPATASLASGLGATQGHAPDLHLRHQRVHSAGGYVIAGTTGAPFCQLDGAGNGPSYYWDPSCNNYTGLGYGAWTPGSSARLHRPGKSAWSTRLGSKVTVVEALDRHSGTGRIRDLVKPVGKIVSRKIRACLSKHQGRRPQARRRRHRGGPGRQKRATEATFDRALVAVGRRPNSSGFGLDKTKSNSTNEASSKVDKQRRTRDPRILAIGDVAGDPGLAHKATAEAKGFRRGTGGRAGEWAPRAIPRRGLHRPRNRLVRLTEREAKEQNVEINVLNSLGRLRQSHQATPHRRTDQTDRRAKDATDSGHGHVGAGARRPDFRRRTGRRNGRRGPRCRREHSPHPTLSETIMESAGIGAGLARTLAKPKPRQ